MGRNYNAFSLMHALGVGAERAQVINSREITPFIAFENSRNSLRKSNSEALIYYSKLMNTKSKPLNGKSKIMI